MPRTRISDIDKERIVAAHQRHEDYMYTETARYRSRHCVYAIIRRYEQHIAVSQLAVVRTTDEWMLAWETAHADQGCGAARIFRSAPLRLNPPPAPEHFYDTAAPLRSR